METDAICLLLVVVWSLVVLITAVDLFGEDEEPREPKASPRRIAYDRLILETSAYYLYRCNPFDQSPRIRSPPVLCTGSDGLQW